MAISAFELGHFCVRALIGHEMAWWAFGFMFGILGSGEAGSGDGEQLAL